MKKVLLFLCLVSFSGKAFSQQSVVTNPKLNILYYGVENPLEVFVNGYKSKDIKLSSDEGEIKTSGNQGNYEISPKKFGIVTIKITSKKNPGKVLGISKWRVKNIPTPLATIAGKHSGEIQKAELLVQLGIVAYLPNFDYEVRFIVTSYTFTVLKRNRTYVSYNAEGPLFSAQVKAALKNLEPGDSFIVSNIKGAGPNESVVDMAPVMFTVVR